MKKERKKIVIAVGLSTLTILSLIGVFKEKRKDIKEKDTKTTSQEMEIEDIVQEDEVEDKQGKLTLEDLGKNFKNSNNAKISKLLIDTNIPMNEEAFKVLYEDEVEEIYLLPSVIEEMDGLKSKKSYLTPKIKKFIADTTSGVLEKKMKYVAFDFNDKERNAVDKNIIEYLRSLSPEERPTLYTSDKNLINKAKCFQCEYILYVQPLNKENDNFQNVPEKKGKLSVKRRDVIVCLDTKSQKVVIKKYYNKDCHVKYVVGDNICKDWHEVDYKFPEIHQKYFRYSASIYWDEENVLTVSKVYIESYKLYESLYKIDENNLRQYESEFHEEIIKTIENFLVKKPTQ